MTSWPAVKVPVVASPAMSSASTSSGMASTTRWAPLTTSGMGLTGTPGRSVAARSRSSRSPRDAGDVVPRTGQRGAQHGADAPRPDDADVEPRGTLVRSAHQLHRIPYSPSSWIPSLARGLAHRAVCRWAGFLRHAGWARGALHDGHARGDRSGPRRRPPAPLGPVARWPAEGRRRHRRRARRAADPPPVQSRAQLGWTSSSGPRASTHASGGSGHREARCCRTSCTGCGMRSSSRTSGSTWSPARSPRSTTGDDCARSSSTPQPGRSSSAAMWSGGGRVGRGPLAPHRAG